MEVVRIPGQPEGMVPDWVTLRAKNNTMILVRTTAILAVQADYGSRNTGFTLLLSSGDRVEVIEAYDELVLWLTEGRRWGQPVGA